MKVFSKEKFIAAEGMEDYKASCMYSDWVNKCNGKRVEGLPRRGACMPNEKEVYYISEKWCIEVPDAVEETGEILQKYFPNGFPKPAPEAVNYRCVPHTKLGNMRYKIIIECDGDTTLAKMIVNGHTVKRVAAKRNPADKFNWRIGAQTAFNRLWEKKKTKPVVREVKRVAKPGEWVKIVRPYMTGGKYQMGDVGRVVRTELSGSVYIEKSPIVILTSEYVVLEGYKPE